MIGVALALEVANVIGVVADEEAGISVLLLPVVGPVTDAALELDDSPLPLLPLEALVVEAVAEAAADPWPLAGEAALEVAVGLMEPAELALDDDSLVSPVFEVCVAKTVHVLVPQLVTVINVVCSLLTVSVCWDPLEPALEAPLDELVVVGEAAELCPDAVEPELPVEPDPEPVVEAWVELWTPDVAVLAAVLVWPAADVVEALDVEEPVTLADDVEADEAVVDEEVFEDGVVIPNSVAASYREINLLDSTFVEKVLPSSVASKMKV